MTAELISISTLQPVPPELEWALRRVGRPLVGSVRFRRGRWLASLPVARGSHRRVEQSFPTETAARLWLEQVFTARRRLGEDNVFDLLLPSSTSRRASPCGSSDFASVADAWFAATYEDLRRGSPDRGDQVRRAIDRHLSPWFVPCTTSVADITYFMVHEWLLQLVGRRSNQPHVASRDRGVGEIGAAVPLRERERELGLVEAAQHCGLSLPTMRRRWRDGQIPDAYRDASGRIRVPARSLGRIPGAKRRSFGLSHKVVVDALWTLRRILEFARANGIFPPGFDPTEGLRAPSPDPSAARKPPPTHSPRPLTLTECARLAGHLHATHQLVLWLQRIMGLRISEAFGLRVSDLVDLGEYGMLAVQGQGGRVFRVRDDIGAIVAVTRKDSLKTIAGTRVLVVPGKLMELLRIVIEAFHTDPETGEIESDARLVPGIRASDCGGQGSYMTNLTLAASHEKLGSDDLGFPVSSHLLRKSVATDLAWALGVDNLVCRRFIGHRAGNDVFGRIYTLDHPDIAPLKAVADLLQQRIVGEISTLVVPSMRKTCWGRANPLALRVEHVDVVLSAAGWQVDVGDVHDPLCDARRVAAELAIATTTARRWMADGLIPSTVIPGVDGVPRRFSRLSDVWAYRITRTRVVGLSDVAEQLGLRYDEVHRMIHHLGLTVDRPTTSRELCLTVGQVEALRAEHGRVRKLHQRSVKLTAAARRLNVVFSTARALLARGELELDRETDTSGARFVTRASVDACEAARGQSRRGRADSVPTMSLPEVLALTGLGRREAIDLIRSGAFQQLPNGRTRCSVTTASVELWLQSNQLVRWH